MPLQKQPISLNFAAGLDTKTDNKQVSIGTLLSLENAVFDKVGRLTKRNGYPLLTELPNDLQTTLTTLNDNLLATGSNLYAYSQDLDTWSNQGIVQPIELDTLPLVRVSTNQSSPDLAVAANGLSCLVYVDSTTTAYYQLSDTVTGQQIVSRTAIGSTATHPRVFTLGRYFIITFKITVGGSPHLQYIAVPISNPSSPTTAADISTSVGNLTTSGYDGIVANNNLYLGWEGAGSTVKLAYLTSTLGLSAAVTITTSTANLVSMAADTSSSTAIIWISFWSSAANNGYVAAYNQNLLSVLAKTQIITTTVITEITSVATNSLLTVFYENLNHYNDVGLDPSSVKTDFITRKTVTQAGTVSSGTVILRSVGLASKPFIADSGVIYLLATYGEDNQPTYFLIDSTGAIYMRLAGTNGGGYEASQVLPTITLIDSTYYCPYLIKDFLAPVNKGTSLPAGTPTNGIYTQTGVNLAKFSINNKSQEQAEIASSLQLTGGQIWQYDGVRPVELGFHVYPENIANTTTSTGGSMAALVYYYVFTYEWTDNQGNLHRSAPSIPYKVDLSGSGTSTNVVSFYVPTLRLTYKISPNPVRIVGYRWSTAQQVYYQFTPITPPIINDPAVDYMPIGDVSSDAQILGAVVLYTTGGVIENIAPPAATASALFKNRYFIIDAEDQNVLWYSKQVIQNTPVEMSDLFTIYVAPTSGAQGSTGPMTALSAMDDKLIIFKKDAIYYLTGTGPDNTGANNDFSDPVFITSSVGTVNTRSIVLMPNGVMFKSDKGIWLLGRDLSTKYIGSPVEDFNEFEVQSAHVIPATNQVRFLLSNSITLMYDYFVNQWGTFTNLNSVSATLYQGLHTYLNQYGQVFQETPNTYLDGSKPVLMSFSTAWINVAGIQGYERFYEGLLLGTYFTPFKLNVQFAYNYNSSPTHSTMVEPDNYSPTWGGEQFWGSGQAWGGPGNIFEARVFPQKQKCESFQLIVNEVYDPSFGQAAGQGLSLSGLNLLVGVKKGVRTSKASQSFG